MSRSRSRSPRNSRRRSRSRDRSEKRRSSPGRRARTRSRSRSTSPSRMTENDAVLNAWRNVKNDFSNFDAWMNLLNLVDQFNDVPVGREVYDRFLDRYPFCYGFWKKYADMERRNNNFTDTVKVWERAISAIPLSIDLWQGFLAFMRELAPVSDEGMDKLNSLYDRALSIAGLEFNSDRLWNEAIAWQESRGDWRKVASIYDKLLQTPTAMFKTHFERYTTIINMYEPDILLQEDEYDEIFSKLRKNTSVGIDQLVIEENVLEESGAPDEEGDRKPVMIPRKKHHPEALAFFRQEILARRQRWHERTAVMLSSRIPYEEQIKRPYFHVKELETTQLKNWREYLEFEVNEGDEARVLVLFERCVIACALYDTMWLKYARYAQKKKGSSAAREIFNRARVHCPKSVNIALAHSALEESKGDFTTALSVLNSFERRQPGFAAISMRKIGIARRQANSERNPDYADVTSQWEALIHSPGTARHLSSFYSIKLARFHLKCRNDRRLAEKVIRRALERDRDNVQLHLQLVDLAYTDPEFSQKKVLEAFDEALKSRLADEERLRLSQRKLDFLEDIGDDIQMLQEHTELHQSLLREIENPHLHTRKRKHERTTRDRDDSRDHRRDSRRDNRDRDSFGGPPQQQMFYQPPQGQMYVPEFNYGFQQQQPNHNNYY